MTDISRWKRSIAERGRRRLGHDQLEGDHLAGQVVPRLIDHAHGPATELPEGGVIGDRLRQVGRLGTAAHAPPLDRLARGSPASARRPSGWRAPSFHNRRSGSVAMRPSCRGPRSADRSSTEDRSDVASTRTGRHSGPPQSCRPGSVGPDRPVVVHERPVRAPQIAQLTRGGIDSIMK